MKTLIYTLTFASLVNLTYAQELVKSCETNVTFETEQIPMKLKIVKDGEGYKAITAQTIEGVEKTYTHKVRYSELPVRADDEIAIFTNEGDLGLGEEDEDEEEVLDFSATEAPTSEPLMNEAETLISNAKFISETLDMASTGQKAGLDLSAVRSAKVYSLEGELNEMGEVSIVEASDKDGKLLGSFLGGFVVSPCK